MKISPIIVFVLFITGCHPIKDKIVSVARANVYIRFPGNPIFKYCAGKSDHDHEQPNTIVHDDTTEIKKCVTVIPAEMKKLKLAYNKFIFHTGNESFDEALLSELNRKQNKFLFNWEKELEEQENGSIYVWSTNNTVTPLFVNEKFASFQIDQAEYTGGCHENGMEFFLNYVFINGKMRRVSFPDLFDSSIKMDTVYFDLQTSEIVFESDRNKIDIHCHYCHYLKPMSDYLKMDSTEYQSGLEDVSFSFHCNGIKIKYFQSFPPGRFCKDPFDSQDVLIPKKELEKILAERWKKNNWMNEN